MTCCICDDSNPLIGLGYIQGEQHCHHAVRASLATVTVPGLRALHDLEARGRAMDDRDHDRQTSLICVPMSATL